MGEPVSHCLRAGAAAQAGRHLPAGAGQGKLDWQLQATGVAAAVVVTIRGRSR